jgi:hypothetical protein
LGVSEISEGILLRKNGIKTPVLVLETPLPSALKGLVDYDLIEVKDSSGAYGLKSRWADPTIRSASGHMRRVFDDRNFADNIGRAGKNAAKSNFELARTAHFIHKRLKAIKRSTNPFAVYLGFGF